MSESAVAKLLEALRELTPSNEATPVWRELGAEARVRGLARRTFREWCQRMGVAIRDVGGIAYVSPPEVDRVIAQGPVRPTPPSLTPQGETDAQFLEHQRYRVPHVDRAGGQAAQAGEDDGELVAAHAGDHVGGAYRVAQPFRHGA